MHIVFHSSIKDSLIGVGKSAYSSDETPPAEAILSLAIVRTTALNHSSPRTKPGLRDRMSKFTLGHYYNESHSVKTNGEGSEMRV